MGWYAGQIYLKIDNVIGDVTPPSKYTGWVSASQIAWSSYQARPSHPDVNSSVGHAGERKVAYGHFPGFRNGEVLVRCGLGNHAGRLQQLAGKAKMIRRMEVHIVRTNDSTVACVLEFASVAGVKSARVVPAWIEVGFYADVGTAVSMIMQRAG
ncbi:MAG TPA: hypothetical protein VJ890_30085 [Vineibacter sp.]|nr:hypothetical protein [Vineibacter sp.]